MKVRLTAILAVIGILTVFMAIRIVLLLPPGIDQGWNSDAAIFGLMAKKILEGRGFDIFFWGQNYMGPLTSLVAAGFGALRGAVDPWALRLATCTNVAAGILVLWAALRTAKLVVATLGALFLAIGPPLLYRASVVANGPDMVLLLGSLLVFTGSLGALKRPAGRWWFGLLCGLSWWMNQGALFFAAGVAWIEFRESASYPTAWQRLRLRDRIFFRDDFFPRTRRLLITLQFLLLADIAYVILRDLLGWRTQITGVRWPLLEPLIALLALHVIVATTQGERLDIRWAAVARWSTPLLIGWGVGYAPVLLGRALDWYPRRYSFGIRFSYPRELLSAVGALFTDALPTLFGMTWVGIVVLVLWLWRRPRLDRTTMILVAAAVANLMFFVLTQRDESGTRYLMPAIPAAWVVAATVVNDFWKNKSRKTAGTIAALLLASLTAGSVRVAREVLREPDPRPVIARLKMKQCAVIYAEFWTAYKFRFLTNEEILFIPYQSLDRTPEDSARFARAPGRRCLLEPDGTIRAYQ